MLPIKHRPGEDDFDDIDKYHRKDTAPTLPELLLSLAIMLVVCIAAQVLLS